MFKHAGQDVAFAPALRPRCIPSSFDQGYTLFGKNGLFPYCAGICILNYRVDSGIESNACHSVRQCTRSRRTIGFNDDIAIFWDGGLIVDCCEQ